MSELFLGLIAAAVVIMAAIQVAAVVFALRAARRVSEAIGRLEQDVRPIVADLQAMSSKAAHATALAVAQVERADQLITDLSRRVEETVEMVQTTIIAPAREGFAVVQGMLGALSGFRPAPAPRPRSAPVDEEDPLFIG